MGFGNPPHGLVPPSPRAPGGGPRSSAESGRRRVVLPGSGAFGGGSRPCGPSGKQQEHPGVLPLFFLRVCMEYSYPIS